MKLSAQHYLDQLPQQDIAQPDYTDEAAPLTVNWQEADGRDSVTIQGMYSSVYRCLHVEAVLLTALLCWAMLSRTMVLLSIFCHVAMPDAVLSFAIPCVLCHVR